MEHLYGYIYYEIICRIMITPTLTIANIKIVSAIRDEIAPRLDIDSF